tara:strand:+ start:1429 stop:1737 length:309 start_codon:yes stop_codon:yes gene_type:complete
MKLIYIKVSTNKNKKLMAKFERNNGSQVTTHFGSKGNKDYTIYYKQDPELAKQKKESYIARHKVNEDWNDPMSAGALAKHILWSEPTIEESIKKFKKKFNLA